MNVALATQIQTLLTADAGVLAVFEQRSYFGQAPQPVVSPYNVVIEVGTVAQETHGTEDDAEDTEDDTLAQFNCYAKTPALALAGRSAIRAALVAKGALAGVVVSRPVQRLFKEELVELWNAQLDLLFQHNPAT